MKPKVSHHAGKGSQRILPGRGAVNDLLKQRPSVNTYAKAGPDVVRASRNILRKKP